MDKLRLITTYRCERGCPGCCNNDFKHTLPSPKDYRNFSQVILTGGEPLLASIKLDKLIAKIRKQTDAQIIVYTAAIEQPGLLYRYITLADGLTLTLHTQKDADLFDEFMRMVKMPPDKSLRLNIFKGVKPASTKGWKVQDNMVWIKDCPLPKGEKLMQLKKLF